MRYLCIVISVKSRHVEELISFDSDCRCFSLDVANITKEIWVNLCLSNWLLLSGWLLWWLLSCHVESWLLLHHNWLLLHHLLSRWFRLRLWNARVIGQINFLRSACSSRKFLFTHVEQVFEFSNIGLFFFFYIEVNVFHAKVIAISCPTSFTRTAALISSKWILHAL